MHLLAAVLLVAAPVAPLASAASVDTGAPATTAAPAAPVHWTGRGSLSVTDVSGNKTLSLLTTRLEVKRTGGRSLGLTMSLGARYGRSGGETAVQDFAGGVETRFLPTGRVSPFVATTMLRDDVKRTLVRVAASSGADLNVLRDTVRRVALGLALLQDYELTQGDPTIVDAPDLSASRTRFSVRLSGTVPVRAGVALDHRTQFEPVADALDDYLLTTETAVRVLLSRRLAFQTTYQFNRDTTPPEGVLFRNDRTLTVGLTVQTD
jgi:hypothetical protein